jgi:hypothetical protein
MPTSINDGPLGLEVKHQWVGADGAAVTLGEQAANPRYKLDRITGLFGLPEADDLRAPRAGGIGEIVYPGNARGKTVTYEGRIQAQSLQQLRQMAATLRRAFAHRSWQGRMDLVPLAAYGTDEWSFIARAVALDMDEDQDVSLRHTWGPFQRTFIIGLRLADPRFYYKARTLAGYTVATGSPGSVNVLGNAPADPKFDIPVGAGANVSITSGGKTLRFLGLPAGTLSVDFAARTAYVGGTDVSGYQDFNVSNWWDENVHGLEPGTNSLSVTGGSGAWQVGWWPRAW